MQCKGTEFFVVFIGLERVKVQPEDREDKLR